MNFKPLNNQASSDQFLYQYSMNRNPPNLAVTAFSLQQKTNQCIPAKKVEGFDRTAPVQSFAAKIDKIKKRPQQETLQDEYVRGLQDQIHYLELQLKLLREKEIAKHSQVDQLETFFGDGIAINENILAIKNGFNNYKVDCEKKIAALQKQKQERSEVIEGLYSRAQRLSEQIQDSHRGFKSHLLGNGQAANSQAKEDQKLREEIEKQEEVLRAIKNENRNLAEKIGVFQRTRQIMSISILKTEGVKFARLNKIRENISEKDKKCEKLEAKFEELKKQEEEKSYVIKIEEDNLKMKKKAISLEKQLNSLQIKVEQKKLELEERLKERQKEITARIDMQERLNAIKESVDRENGLSIEDLQRIAHEKEIAHLQKIIDQNKKLSKYVSFYGDLLARLEDEIQTMGEQKPDLKRQLEAYRKEVKILQQDVENFKNKRITLGSEIAESESKINFINEVVPPAIERIKKSNEKIKFLQTERQRLNEDIKVRQKQLELIEILKGLTLEDIEISSSSNSSIQDRLVDFMRNWESLSRN